MKGTTQTKTKSRISIPLDPSAAARVLLQSFSSSNTLALIKNLAEALNAEELLKLASLLEDGLQRQEQNRRAE